MPIIPRNLLKLGPELLDRVLRFRRVNGNLPLKPMQEAALQKMDDNIIAGKNLNNLIGRNRVNRELDQRLANRTIWDKIFNPSNASWTVKDMLKKTRSYKHLKQEDEAINKAMANRYTLQERLLNDVANKQGNEFRFNPTQTVGQQTPGSWQVSTAPRVNTAASLKEYQNLPKNIRGAYEAGHYVNPDPAWGLKEMTSGNNLPYQPRW